MTGNDTVRLRTRTGPEHSTHLKLDLLNGTARLSYRPIASLRDATRQVRRHNKRKRELIKTSYVTLGELSPIIVTEEGEIVDGHERVRALRELGRETVLTLTIPEQCPDLIRTARLILNRAHEVGVSWLSPNLAKEFEDLLAHNPTLIAATGFSMADVDGALFKAVAEKAQIDAPARITPVTRPGDLWEVGNHRILCGNARACETYTRLLGSTGVDMLLADPPYGTSVRRVSWTHEEFVEGSGLTADEARTFFGEALDAMSGHLKDGAIADFFIDAAGMASLAIALKKAGFAQKDICVWDKEAGGMGSLYRHQVEFVIVTKWGTAPHTNNIMLGRHKRNRTTLWSNPGMGQWGPGRAEAVAMHAAVKPVGLLVEALLDTSNRGDVILDPFVGTGSTLLACDRIGRVGRGIELDPRHVDTALSRLEAETGKPAVLIETGQCLADVAKERREADLSRSAAQGEARR